MIEKLKKLEKKYIIGTILVFISVLIITSVIWGNRTFSVKTLNQIIFHLKVPMDGTDSGVYLDWFLFSVPISLLIVVSTVIELIAQFQSFVFSEKYNNVNKRRRVIVK